VTQVHFLPPIPYEEYKDMNTTQIAETVKEAIRNKMDQLASPKAK
jgi:1-acyl-sn-glycerol-3-phosphate acyltransferase